ncbi:MAG: PAQR family membrane homeostasis protein TrhA [Spirochaetaceae bacterium]
MSTKTTEAEGWLERHITLHTHDTVKEEKASGIVHAAGAVASAAALVLLTIKGVASGSSAMAASYMVYSLSMLILYLSSSLYHFAPVSNKKRILRICDHMSIYLLIAGTYTPVSVALGGYWGTLTLILIWSFAAAGMAFKIVFWGRFGFVQVAVYILMGWMVVLVGKPILEAFPPEFIYTALAGGITYTSGTIVYAMKKLPYYHALWHLFVLTGSVLFFFAIYLYI